MSGIISGFFSSLSLPSISRLPMLLSLGPGEPSPVVVPCDNSFRLNRLRRRPPQGIRITTIMANAPMTSAADRPITTDNIGVSVNGVRGRSVTKHKKHTNILYARSEVLSRIVHCIVRTRYWEIYIKMRYIPFGVWRSRCISVAISVCINIPFRKLSWSVKVFGAS